MDYTFATQKRKSTPQNEAIPGRESEMKQNLAGGYGFKASQWNALRRWLLTGSMNDAFYQGREEMTKQNLNLLKACMDVDPEKVGEEIVEASKLGISVHTPIFATAFLSTGDKKAKDTFKEIFPSVIRTASHLYEVFNYIRDLRGLGTVIHKAGLNWINSKEVQELEYQFLKYQNRYNWTGRDILRVLKPKTKDEARKALYNWIVGGSTKNPKIPAEEMPDNLSRIKIYETLKKGVSEDEAVYAIEQFNLTHEMIPANIERTTKIWEALFNKMPVNATIRNLGNLTEKGVFEKLENLDILEERLNNRDKLKRAYVHPVNFASALKVYLKGGNIGRGKLNWDPKPRVVDIMEDGVELSFDVVEPTGASVFHALDVSGSMRAWGFFGSGNRDVWLEPYEVEGVMALAHIKNEKNYFAGGFDTNFIQMKGLTKNTTFREVSDPENRSIWPSNFGGTDASVAYDYAIRKNINADVFIFWTDSESWAGRKHPSQVLAEYRKKVNKDAKAIYVTLVPYGDHITLVDPKDPMSYDIAGFTGQTPKLINMIIKGDI
jgi:60 kDa SS-A/Ro ribonucleoprotein